MKHTATLFLIFLFPVLSFSQPHAINYQGVARNAQGLPLINHSISLRLSILDSTVTGPAVYVETQTVTTSNTGLFNIGIGLGSAVSGTFNSILWGQGDKWLKIEMDTVGGSNFSFIGTTQFLSVPYALHAMNGVGKGTTQGDMLYWDGNSWIKLPVGPNGYSLALCNGIPTWGGCPISVTTDSVEFFLSNYNAVSGGRITNADQTLIIAKGVCFATSPNPTINNNKTDNGSSTHNFISNLGRLALNTVYFFRAYAINSQGIIYGNEVSFTTPNFGNLPNVSICSQIWTQQNLSVSTYRNGDSIPKVTDPTVWANLTTGAYCYYNNDSATYAATYGKLYNWYAVNDPRGLSPVGWHLPSDSEWRILETCLGGSSVAGGKMKETGTAHWLSPNTGATNSSGFTGHPGGLRFNDGTFASISTHGNWWSSTESVAGPYYFFLHYSSGNMYWANLNKQFGFSVRCVRD